MILLFGDKAAKTASTKKNTNVNNHPVENSGILAMSLSDAKSLLTMGEYDTYISSSPIAINYAMYANMEFSSDESGFTSCYSEVLSAFSDCGFASGASFAGASAGFSGGSSGGSFASVC